MTPEKTKATIYDVAARAGVAISTVSRVLNDSNDVSDPTRKRVLRAIDELQFRPDRTAKTLAQRQTRSLAIAIPTFTTPFHNELLKGVRMTLREHDIDLLLCDLGSSQPQRTLMRFLKRGAVDGLLLAGLPVDEALGDELKALRAPVILVGYPWDHFDAFYWDNEAGAQQAVAHLVEQGHRRIGLIRTHTESILQDQRIEGYRKGLEEAGLPFEEAYVQSGHTEKHAGFSEEAGYEAMQGLLALDARPTAVFASSDVQAIGAWKAIRDQGLRVPDDIALVGYDDVKTSEYIGLSSVDQDMHGVGEEATEVLLERVKGVQGDGPVSVKKTPTLRVRYSSEFRRND